jgi:hypothetical protein
MKMNGENSGTLTVTPVSNVDVRAQKLLDPMALGETRIQASQWLHVVDLSDNRPKLVQGVNLSANSHRLLLQGTPYWILALVWN